MTGAAQKTGQGSERAGRNHPEGARYHALYPLLTDRDPITQTELCNNCPEKCTAQSSGFNQCHLQRLGQYRDDQARQTRTTPQIDPVTGIIWCQPKQLSAIRQMSNPKGITQRRLCYEILPGIFFREQLREAIQPIHRFT